MNGGYLVDLRFDSVGAGAGAVAASGAAASVVLVGAGVVSVAVVVGAGSAGFVAVGSVVVAAGFFLFLKRPLKAPFNFSTASGGTPGILNLICDLGRRDRRQI